MTSTKTDRLQHFGIKLFSGISPESTDLLAEGAKHVPFQMGQTVVAAGQKYPGLICVLSGQLKYARANRSGKEQVFEIADQGDTLGYEGIASNHAIDHDVAGRKNGEYLLVHYSNVRKAMERDPVLALNVVREAGASLTRMRKLADALSLKDANERLAAWLVTWIESSRKETPDEPFQAVLPFTQSEIAAQVGTVREVISRGFTRMEREGLLTVSGKRIRILSLDGLRKYSSATA
ncbi:MAG: Crp/Fnr family transcriptional regulator [Planctomycetes bacterium]|nr:Crp/Fnr family transcriptional regulator [Planctomycetota bacterium]NUQ33537.1 Crp/Fnr family transcriptional regulator [Planctomycetaceae bacterium]